MAIHRVSLVATWLGSAAAVVVTALLSSSAIAAEDAESNKLLGKRVEALLEPFKSLDSPGCAVGIVRDGELIFHWGFGCLGT